MAKGITELISDFKILHPLAYDRIYQQGRADGYSQAETDYHKQSEKDRQSAYDCGYEKGRADAMCEIAHELLEEVRISLTKLKEKKNVG